MNNATTTTMIFDNSEYFVANLTDGGVRIGMNHEGSLSLPANHADYAKVVAFTSAEEVEQYFYIAYASFLFSL